MEQRKKIQRDAYIFMLPEHGNIGDYAIGYAEEQFLKERFPEYHVKGITTPMWLYDKTAIKLEIKPEDIIFFNGGGYIGDLWEDSYIYREMVEAFPENKKIFFPNTLSYKHLPTIGNEVFEEDVNWFNDQKNTYVFFREEYSNERYVEAGGISECFIDMALYLNYKNTGTNRCNKVLLCMRDDRERIFEGIDCLKKDLSLCGMKFDEYDLNRKRRITQEEGRQVFLDTVELFQKYDCVVTDRLHGMLIATICNVPCIAFDNSTHKIKHVYNSSSILPDYVLMLDDYCNDIGKHIENAKKKKRMNENYIRPDRIYEHMAKKITGLID